MRPSSPDPVRPTAGVPPGTALGPGADAAGLDALLALSPAVLFSLAPGGDHPVTYMSANAVRLLGHEPAAFLADSRYGERHLHPDDRIAFREALDRLPATGSATLEHRFLTGWGQYRWFRDDLRLVRDAEGRPLRVVGCMVDVDERVQAAARLRESERRFRDYAEAASDWFWEMDADLRFTYFSERLKDVVGVDPAEVVGFRREEIAADDADAPAWRAHLADLAARRPFRNFEYRFRRSDGRLLHFRISGVPIHGADGAFCGYRGTGTDITAQRTAEDALRRSQAEARQAEQRLADAIESLSEGFILLDPDRRFVLCNARYREMFPGLADLLVPGTPFEAIARHHARSGLLHPSIDVEAWLADRLRPVRDHVVREERLADGRWVRISDHATKDGGTVGLRTDVTRLKRQEEELLRRQRELAETQRLARVGRWRWPIESTDLEWSEDVYRMMGAAPGAYRPTLAGMVDLVHPADRQALIDVLDRLAAGGGPEEIEYRVTALDGVERVVWAEGHGEPAPAGGVAAVYGVCQDVTERKRIEDELRAAKEAAESASRAKSSFLASMSHELRTPLNAILGFSEVLRDELFGPLGHPRYAEYARDIHASGTHLLELINGVLDLAKIEAGKYELREETVELRDLVDEALRLAAATASPAHRFGATFEPAATCLWADRRALRQVLLNLLSNAVKFSPDGGEVSVDVRRRGDAVEIGVVDRGIGIPEARLAEIGQPFVQVESVLSRRHAGSGIGLHITRSLVELHGGRIEIESREGVGTRVVARLPAHRIRAWRPRPAEQAAG